MIEASKERWRRGAAAFKRLLEPSMKGKLAKQKTIRSAIYGNMTFNEVDMRLLESFYLQRLRGISQMGLLHLVYPDARHSRFEHSLGVRHSLESLLEADPGVKAALLGDLPTLYAAALLHDCGHGPFSHTTETLLEASGLDVILRKPSLGEAAHVKPHERRCRDLVLDRDFHLKNLGIDTYGIRETLESLGIEPSRVVGLVTGQQPAVLANLLSGNFDVDKMDYFRRDAFFTGTMGGGVDMEAIQRWVRLIPGSAYPEIGYDRRLVGHLLHLLFAREHVYSVTAYHPVSRVAAVLLLVAGDLALRGLEPEVGAEIYANIELFNDQEFLAVLEVAAAHAISDYALLLRRTVERLSSRRLHKRLRTLSRSQFEKAFSECIPQLQEEGGLPSFAYCRLSEIAGGKYSHLLPDEGLRDDVIILEMTPCIGPINSGEVIEKEMNTLEGLQILDPSAQGSLSMAQWLEDNSGKDASTALARALRAYKLSIWRALVLVPACVQRGLTGNEDAFIADFATALCGEARRPAGLRPEWKATLGLVGERVKSWREGLGTVGSV